MNCLDAVRDAGADTAIGHEQRRLGEDLHDGLGQELTGLSLLLSAGRMKDINPNDDHSTLRCGVCAPSCND
jgi:signal transduction histidine kinase